MNVTRFSRALKHGRANSRFTFFYFVYFFFCRNCIPIVTKPRRKSPLGVVAVGKCVSKSRRRAFFDAFLHNSSSPRSFLFYSSLDFCVYLRSMPIHSNSRRFLAESRDATQHRTLSRARAVYLTCTPISNLDAYPRCVLHVRTHVFAHIYAYRTHRPVGEIRTWAWHYRECNIKLK